MIRAEISKTRTLSDDLLKRAIEFHGHGGPFLVIGLRMGLLALERLNCRGWFDVRCRALVTPSPPYSCIVDGIQCSTGCTMGKRNIDIEAGEDVAADFTNDGKRVRITLRREVLERIQSKLGEGDEEDVENLIGELISASDAELFEIS